MVLLLPVDVMRDALQHRRTDAECAVSTLPGEASAPEPFMDPFRRIRLEFIDEVRYGNRRGQCREQVHMIVDSADRHGRRAKVPRDATKVGV
jgi:hypothetical protein